MLRCIAAAWLACAILLSAPALARAADEPAALSKASPAKYKIVVEQYAKGELVGSTEFTVYDSPEMGGVQL